MSFCDLEKALKNIEIQNDDFCNITDPLCDISDNEAMNNDDLAVPAFNFSFNPVCSNFVNPMGIDGAATTAQKLDNLLVCKTEKRRSVCDMKLLVSSKVINQDDIIRQEPVYDDSDPWAGAFDGFTPFVRHQSIPTEIPAPRCTNINIITTTQE